MLKSARVQAGLSMEKASEYLHMDRRTLGGYEKGARPTPPEVVLQMAEVYKRPDLPAQFCAYMCPIGQLISHQFKQDHMATMVLGLLKEFEDVEKKKSQLVSIAADGKLSDDEKSEFQSIIKELVELEKQIGELKIFATKAGISMEDIMPTRKKEKSGLKTAFR